MSLLSDTEAMHSKRRITNLMIHNDLAELAIVSEALDRVLEGSGISGRQLVHLQVALDEVLSNVIKYAWPEGSVHELRVRINAKEDAVEVVIVDDGEAFDPRGQAPPKSLSEGCRPPPGGLGIHW